MSAELVASARTTGARLSGRAADLFYLLARVVNVAEVLRSHGTPRRVVWQLRSGASFCAESRSSDIHAVREILLRDVFPIHHQRFGLVVDIGAHVGVFSAAVCSRADRVVAFEPTVRNYTMLKEHCRSPRANLEIHQLAVSGDGRELRINLHPDNTGQHSIFAHAVETAGVESIRSVASAALLTFCRTEMIDLLKVDAEGAEHEILAAAAPVLAKTRQVIVEANTVDAGRTPRHVAALLTQAGFAVSRLSGDEDQSVFHGSRIR